MKYTNNRLIAFRNAYSGLIEAFKKESHFKLHVLALLIVLNVGFYFKLNTNEWLAIILCSAMVISLELINSAIEALCDLVMPEKHASIKYIKDVAAGAVLISAIASIVVAYLVFWPHLFQH
ncbi:MAG: diacylglycerol kinase family protein [Bacteroidota bacterium]